MPNELFRWQLDLFWYGHCRVYGTEAASRAHAILINRENRTSERISQIGWNITVPYSVCTSVFDSPQGTTLPNAGLAVPLNIQIGLEQVLSRFADDQILEVTDCDMVHFRPSPVGDVPPDELYVSTVYEDWHLKSLSANRYVVAPYFEHHGGYYNGGFVPIIGRANTFRKILPEWIAVHCDILHRPYDNLIHWWAGMFALQAACEKACVQMVAKDYCYAPLANQLTNEHYIGHYCVDTVFNKRTYPNIDTNRFPDNAFYNLIKDWIGHKLVTAP